MAQNSAPIQKTGLRSLLWVVFVLSAVANALASSLGAPLLISVSLGVLALASAITLIVQHYRRARA